LRGTVVNDSTRNQAIQLDLGVAIPRLTWLNSLQISFLMTCPCAPEHRR
jgi:hypothetical protein